MAHKKDTFVLVLVTRLHLRNEGGEEALETRMALIDVLAFT